MTETSLTIEAVTILKAAQSYQMGGFGDGIIYQTEGRYYMAGRHDDITPEVQERSRGTN